MLGRNCCSRLLTEASTNGGVALSAWYSRMGAISNICLNKKVITAFGIQYCRSSPTFTQFGRGVFEIFAIKHAGPVFLGHPVHVTTYVGAD